MTFDIETVPDVDGFFDGRSFGFLFFLFGGRFLLGSLGFLFLFRFFSQLLPILRSQRLGLPPAAAIASGQQR